MAYFFADLEGVVDMRRRHHVHGFGSDPEDDPGYLQDVAVSIFELGPGLPPNFRCSQVNDATGIGSLRA